MDARLERAQGALLGSLVGDALGTTVEFSSASTIARRYPDGLREVVGGGPFGVAAGQVTDDGELTLALARSIVEQGGYDNEAAARAYANWLASGPFDVGNTIGVATRAGAEAVRTGASAADACRSAANENSQANGSMMRSSPLGIVGWALPPDQLADLARRDSTLTHPHPVCVDAVSVYVVALAHGVRDGATPRVVYEATLAWATEAKMAEAVLEALHAAVHGPPDEVDGPKQGWCLIALQAAFWALLGTDTFEDALASVIALGGDTDTNGAITGGLVGAVHGLGGIPEPWRQTALHCRPEAGQPGVRRPRPPEYWATHALEIADDLLELGWLAGEAT